MSSNRQQLATGLKAILGGASGAARPHLAPVVETADAAVTAPEHRAAPGPEIEIERPLVTAPGAAFEPASMIAEPAAAPATAVRQSKRKRKVEPAVFAPSNDKRVGTLDRPYVVGVVLPVDLAERLQIHCIKNHARPNSFIEQAIATAREAGA